MLHLGLIQKPGAYSHSLVEGRLPQWRLHAAVIRGMQLPVLQLQMYQHRSKNGELDRVLKVGLKVLKQWLKKLVLAGIHYICS